MHQAFVYSDCFAYLFFQIKPKKCPEDRAFRTGVSSQCHHASLRIFQKRRKLSWPMELRLAGVCSCRPPPIDNDIWCACCISPYCCGNSSRAAHLPNFHKQQPQIMSSLLLLRLSPTTSPQLIHSSPSGLLHALHTRAPGALASYQM